MRKPYALLLAAIVSSSAALAETPQFLAPYDATYDVTNSNAKMTLRQMCDGKGHIRSETVTNGMKTVSIIDYPGKQTITILDMMKKYMKRPLPPQEANKGMQTDLKPPSDAKQLGTKVVDGHPCHGYQTSANGATCVVWIGDDIKNLVMSETTTPHGNQKMELKSYSKGAPSQDLLAIPSGYSEMVMKTK